MSDPRLAIIPARALDLPNLTHNALRVLVKLGKHADKNGWWRLSQVRIAEDLNIGRSTVQDCIKRLEDAELIEKHPVESKSGRDSAHFYRVVYDFGSPETGVPKEVQETRIKRQSKGENGEAPPAGNPAPPAGNPAPPAGNPAPPAESDPAPPAGPGPAPNITTPDNETLSRDARARDESEGSIPPEKGLMLSSNHKRDLHKGWQSWDEGLTGSINQIEREAQRLDDEAMFMRATDIDRIAAFKRIHKDAGFDYLGAYSNYIKDRKFDIDPVNRAMDQLAARRNEEKQREEYLKSTKRLAPFGKAWMAERLKRLAAGTDVSLLDNKRMGPSELPDHDHFVQIESKGKEWRRWQEWHAAMEYPLPKGSFPDWIWVPSEDPPPYPDMTWEVERYSAEMVRCWFNDCKSHAAQFLRKQYDQAIQQQRSIWPRVPVRVEKENVQIASKSEQWQILQKGLKALDRAELPNLEGVLWDVPIDLWNELWEAAQSTGEGQ